MDVMHRVFANGKSRFKASLDQLGVDYEYEESIVGKTVFFVISENAPLWPDVSRLMQENDIKDSFIHTEFSKGERKSAPFLELGAWYNGYPQPEDNYDYHETTYNRPNFCEKCCIGKIQQGPFRLRGEPKWGRRSIMTLNWIHNEFFVRPEVWHDVFKPFGIGCRPVLKHSTGEELKTVVQLDVTKMADSLLCLDGYPIETCEVCGQLKYHPIARGFFPKFSGLVDGDMFRTQEWFGSGGKAFQAVIVSNQLYQEMEAKKIKGAEFMPMASE